MVTVSVILYRCRALPMYQTTQTTRVDVEEEKNVQVQQLSYVKGTGSVSNSAISVT